MAHVIWVACHSAAPLDAERVEAWQRQVEHRLPDLFDSRRFRCVVKDHVALLAWSQPSAASPSWPQVEEAAGALGVNDGFPLGHDRIPVAGPAPIAISRALRADFSQVEAMHPPYANVALDVDGLTVAIDATGFAKVYRAGTDGLSVWSNRGSVASLFAYGTVAASPAGWATYLCHDRFMSELTALDGVVLEQPRTLVRATDTPHGLDVRHTDYVTPLFQPDLDWDAADLVEQALSEFYTSLAALAPEHVRVPLSGGRDSRIIAAAGLRQGIIDEFYTSAPPDLDLELAEQLVARLEHPVAWTTHDKTAAARRRNQSEAVRQPSSDAVWRNLLAYQGYADGDGDVTPHTRPPHGEAALHRVALWGLGGEFARATFYNASALPDPSRRAREYFRNLGNGPLVADAVRAELVAPRALAIAEGLEQRGVSGLKQLDYMHLFEQCRRIKNRLGNVNGIRPLYSLGYVRSTMGRSPAYRVHTSVHRDVVNRCYPAWAGVPFSSELRRERPVATTATPFAVVFWESEVARRLGEALLERVSAQDVVVESAVRRIMAPDDPARSNPVRRMRWFNRLLNYFSYLDYADELSREFTAAGGIAAVRDRSPRPPSTTPSEGNRPLSRALRALTGRGADDRTTPTIEPREATAAARRR